jgi:hypothetical protein
LEQLVYRIEKPYEGSSAGVTGPYTALWFEGHGDDDHPSPFQDFDEEGERLMIREHEYCGMGSLREIKEWFAGFGKKIADNGYRLVALSVPEQHIRRGQAQVVFDRTKARVIHEMNPADHIYTKEGK